MEVDIFLSPTLTSIVHLKKKKLVFLLLKSIALDKNSVFFSSIIIFAKPHGNFQKIFYNKKGVLERRSSPCVRTLQAHL